MADLPVSKNWSIDEPDDVLKLRMEVRLQELVSRRAKTRQTMEDIQKGQLKQLMANEKMLSLEIEKIELEISSIDITED